MIAGVPIITVLGKSFANNVCASILSSLGLKELICKDFDEYKNKAINLGKNPEKLLNLKKKIKSNIIKKPLFNSKSYTKNLSLVKATFYFLFTTLNFIINNQKIQENIDSKNINKLIIALNINKKIEQESNTDFKIKFK